MCVVTTSQTRNALPCPVMTWVEATPGAPLLIHATRYDDAPLHLHTLPCARALPQTRSPDERDPRAHKGNVPALRLPHIISRKKMHIGRDPAQVAIELPLGTELGRRGDVACAASRRQGQVARRAVDTIPPRVPPEHVAPERYEDVVAWQQLQGGVDVNEVARADDAGVIKIARLKKEGIERPECPTAVMPGVAADHIELQSQAGLHRGVCERVAAGRADCPGQNIAMAEPPDLEDRLDIVVEAVRFAKHPGAEGLAHLFAGPSGIAGERVLEAQVIEIRFEIKRHAERGRRAIDAPEELAGELIIELLFLVAAGLRHEGIDLPPATAPNQLQSVELERDVWPCPRRHQPPGTVAHLEATPAHDEVGRGRRGIGVQLQIQEGLLEIHGILIGRGFLARAADLQT